jgi:hypothetical protein
MFCILAFIVFLILYPILGIFSPAYRYLFKRSFECVFKKITLKPCDIDLKTEIKGKMISKKLARNPKFIKFFDKSFDSIALVLVVLSIWSLIYTAIAGLNLFVYDTCSPASGESCSLSGEACGVASGAPTFSQAIEQNRLGEWAVSPVTELTQTISLIPNRLRDWNGEDYITDRSTYYSFNESNSVALEIIDPGCQFCKQLYQNIKNTDFTDRYNLTYILYPIPDENTQNGYKFQHAYLISTYLEAVKDIEPANQNSELTPDWYILDALFTRPGETTATLQEDFNLIFSEEEAVQTLHDLLQEYGYSDEEIDQIQSRAASDEISSVLDNNRVIVEEDIQTIRIPTIMFDGRRYDRVIDENKLNQ